jgi:hypothetical protein
VAIYTHSALQADLRAQIIASQLTTYVFETWQGKAETRGLGLEVAVIIVIGRLHLLSLPETSVRKHPPKVATMESTEREARLLQVKLIYVN